MEIILFVLGVIFIIIGLPFCFSCQIHILWENMSTRKRSQTNQPTNQHITRDRTISLFFIMVGIILIVLSFAGSIR
jgi:hypothetical protein